MKLYRLLFCLTIITVSINSVSAQDIRVLRRDLKNNPTPENYYKMGCYYIRRTEADPSWSLSNLPSKNNYTKALEYFKQAACMGHLKSYTSWMDCISGIPAAGQAGWEKKKQTMLEVARQGGAAGSLPCQYFVWDNTIEPERKIWEEKLLESTMAHAYISIARRYKTKDPDYAIRLLEKSLTIPENNIFPFTLSSHIRDETKRKKLEYVLAHKRANREIGSIYEDENYEKCDYYIALVYYERANFFPEYGIIDEELARIKSKIDNQRLFLRSKYPQYFTNFNKPLNNIEADRVDEQMRQAHLLYRQKKYAASFDITENIVRNIGDQNAIYNLALHYEYGNGILRDSRKSIELLKALDEDEQVNNLLGLVYLRNLRGIGEKVAHHLFERASENNFPDAFYNLGNDYRFGRGVAQDNAKALDYYDKGAKVGSLAAMNALGDCYRDGIGVEKDPIKAFSLYQKSAQNGHSVAMKNLANCYDRGEGTNRSDELCSFWKAKYEETLKESYEDGVQIIEPPQRGDSAKAKPSNDSSFEEWLYLLLDL